MANRQASRPGTLRYGREAYRDSLAVAALLLLSGVFCFLHLNQGALYYDEAIYAQVAKETVAGDHWITLHWNGQPWFHKPPLYFWTTALLFKAFGPSEFSARALSAAAGVGCITLTYLIAKHLYDRNAGLISGVILLTSALFLVNARQGMTDVLMTFFILLSVYAYLRSSSESQYWIIVGAACGFAVLTKGVAGLLAPAIIGASIILDRRSQALKQKTFWSGVVAFATLAASWHCILIAIHGQSFLETYLFRHIIERSVSDLHRYNYSYGFYFSVLWDFVWPWAVLMLPAVLVALKRKHSKVLVVQALLPFILFSLARTKFSWYAVPVIPALAILVGLMIRTGLERVGPKMQLLVWSTVVLFSIAGTYEVWRHSRPDEEIQAVAKLARYAAENQGAISSCPESFEMTVLYYSNRRLCVDPVISPLSFGEATQCNPGEIQHFIFQNHKRALIESRFGAVRVIAESQNVIYGEINSQAVRVVARSQ